MSERLNRSRKFFEAHLYDGKSVKQLAQDNNISTSRVRQIIEEYKRYLGQIQYVRPAIKVSESMKQTFKEMSRC
jgi:transposase